MAKPRRASKSAQQSPSTDSVVPPAPPAAPLPPGTVAGPAATPEVQPPQLPSPPPNYRRVAQRSLPWLGSLGHPVPLHGQAFGVTPSGRWIAVRLAEPSQGVGLDEQPVAMIPGQIILLPVTQWSQALIAHIQDGACPIIWALAHRYQIGPSDTDVLIMQDVWVLPGSELPTDVSRSLQQTLPAQMPPIVLPDPNYEPRLVVR